MSFLHNILGKIGVAISSVLISFAGVFSPTPVPQENVVATPTPIMIVSDTKMDAQITKTVSAPKPKDTLKPPVDSVLCNGEYYPACPTGQRFTCGLIGGGCHEEQSRCPEGQTYIYTTTNGGLLSGIVVGSCVNNSKQGTPENNQTTNYNQQIVQNTPPPNSTLCNSIYWSKCQTGQNFVCPSVGNAYCQNPSSQSAPQQVQQSNGANLINQPQVIAQLQNEAYQRYLLEEKAINDQIKPLQEEIKQKEAQRLPMGCITANGAIPFLTGQKYQECNQLDLDIKLIVNKICVVSHVSCASGNPVLQSAPQPQSWVIYKDLGSDSGKIYSTTPSGTTGYVYNCDEFGCKINPMY